MVVAVVSALVGAGLVPPAPATAATTGGYVRVSRTFAKVVPLRTRGYYPEDGCLFAASAACKTASGNYRKEATAQARAIRRLSSVRHMLASPLPNTFSDMDQVQWEVAPAPDSTYAPDNTSEPPEPPDPAPLAPPNCDQNTGWRIDIATDDPKPVVNNVVGMMEVKDWALGTKIDEVNDQLNCYKFKGEQYAGQFGTGIRFDRSTELNVPQLDTGHPWSESYLGAAGEVWCVWADPVVSAVTAGNIYFALATDATIPELVRDYTPGCDVEADRESKEAYKKYGAAAATTIMLGIITARKVAMTRSKETKAPVISPEAQTTDNEEVPVGMGHWAVTAPKAGTPTTLQMCYGDGVCETRPIPAGSDSRTFTFSHTFSATGTYGQLATLVESGASTASTTHVSGSSSVTISPSAQVTQGPASWTVTVKQDPARTTHLTFDYGYRTYLRSYPSESGVLIPQGSGYSTFTFSYWFNFLALDPTPQVQRAVIEETGAKTEALTAYGPKGAAPVIAVLNAVEGRTGPVVYGPAHYRVIAPKDPARPTTLWLWYGDAYPGYPYAPDEIVTVPQGTGVATFDFWHSFPIKGLPGPIPGVGEPVRTRWYFQIAEIAETGAFGQAVTEHVC